MTSIYGLPALEVIDSDGEAVIYLFRQVVPEGRERRAYVVTKPNGDENRLSDMGAGHWVCTCKAFIYKDRWNVEKRGRCKHLTALCGHLEPETEPVELGAA
jgi:hypothetical protein